ncbi:MAG: hypothetical protein RLZZ248_1973 [Bacteroidota bacterium]
MMFPNTIKKIIGYGTALSTVVILSAIFFFRQFNVPQDLHPLIIPIAPGTNFEQVTQQLIDSGVVVNPFLFRFLGKQMQYDRYIKSGRFAIQSGWNTVELIRNLRMGANLPIRITINQARLVEELAGQVGAKFYFDSINLTRVLLADSTLASLDLDSNTLMSLFIPNTYEMYWNTTPEGFIQRMKKERDHFWNQSDRLKKAKLKGLSPEEVYTMASIVEKETLIFEEKKRMAGVYLNRIEQGIPLQADPTAVFARRDFETGRVTYYHTKFDNPYNTYLYTGLPPGPICMASIASIDAVLNAEDHDYLYFCALGDGSGKHSFATDLRGHSANVRIYQKNLRKRGLR